MTGRMRIDERALLRKKLDEEQRAFRVAAKKAGESPQWLRRVRQGLGIRATEMARDLDVNVSVIFRLEKSEEQRSISLRALKKMADTMECRLVYAVVPRGGKTMAELAEERRWKKRLGKGKE
jgi:transcriptional regulator with XRE-family HTH domain